jgi:hypothetical protein
VAIAAAPYVHPRLAAVTHAGEDEGYVRIERIEHVIVRPADLVSRDLKSDNIEQQLAEKAAQLASDGRRYSRRQLLANAAMAASRVAA